jgi:hypothetical protein
MVAAYRISGLVFPQQQQALAKTPREATIFR